MKVFGIEERAVRSAIGFAVTAARETTGLSTTAMDVGPVDEVSEDVLGERLFALAAWSCLVEPGDSTAAMLVQSLGAERALEIVIARREAEQILDELRTAAPGSVGATALELPAIAAGRARWAPRISERPVMEALATARRAGLSLLAPGADLWPRQLDDLGVHAPLCMWARGVTTTLTAAPMVAIVGARAATSYGEHVAMELSAELTGRGIVVVSGAAYGIDGVAHRAALAAGGPTIAVLAGGVDRSYPAGHTDLLDRVAVNGAVLSELAPGAAPTRWRFLQRNRVIAALGEATVVVEAGARSGSLNTAGHAATLGRAVGAVPGPVTSAASAGCHRLLREFDAQCVTSAHDVIEMLGGGPGGGGGRGDAAAAHGAGGSGSHTDDATRVMDALSARSWRTPSDVAARAGLSLADTEGFLGMLALEGRAVRGDAGWRTARAT